MAVPSAAPVQATPAFQRTSTTSPLFTVKGPAPKEPAPTFTSRQSPAERVSVVPFQIPVATVFEAVGPVAGERFKSTVGIVLAVTAAVGAVVSVAVCAAESVAVIVTVRV
jgi:hypothetical protein